MKTLQNNFTTPEQSKRLLELGVPADSADCCLRRILTDGGYCETWRVDVFDFIGHIHDDYLPCWSVGRLMEIITICNLTDEKPCVYIERDNIHEMITAITDGVNNNMLDFSKLEE